LEELKALKAQVKKKLDVLAQLRKNKTGPAHRLATLSDVSPEQLWLTGYSETGDSVKIAGLAFTEDLIAAFMRSLEASADYAGVELVVSEQTETAGTKLKKFEIACKLRSTADTVNPQSASSTAGTPSVSPPTASAPVSPVSPAPSNK
jgi:type IV pilus assembly protein PilN